MVNAGLPNWSYPIAESLQHLAFMGGYCFTVKSKKHPNKSFVMDNKQLLQMYNIAIDPKNHDLDYGQFMDMFQDKLNLSDWDIILLNAFVMEEIEYYSKNKTTPGYFFEAIKDGTAKSRKRNICLLGKWWKDEAFELPSLYE